MTDKQIIYNGVDVSGCKYWKGYCRIAFLCDYSGHLCEVTPNCYYKQLKRKEQELQEVMDNYVQLDLQRVKEYNELVDLYKAKEQECEKAKKNAQDTYELYQALMESFNILQGEKIKLEQECETLGQAYLETNELLQEKTKECTNLKAYNDELKKANKHIEHNRNQKADKLMRIEKLITACQTGYTDEFIQKLLIILHEKEPNSFENKYKATLIEIKDIAKQCFGKDFCTGCKYCEQCYVKNGKISTYDVCKIILQKIRECEVEND